MSKKLLTDLLKRLPDLTYSDILSRGNNIEQIKINGIKLDSRDVESGDLFIAYKGTNLDGRDYISEAINKGAKVVLYEKYIGNSLFNLDYGLSANLTVIFIPVNKLDKFISAIAAEFYDNPSLTQEIYAITGTNGKTTCSFLLAQLLFYLKNKHKNIELTDIGLIGTIGYGTVGQIIVNENYNKLNTTTPDPILVQKILADYKRNNINHIALEASSHALSQSRLAAVNISTAIFTNLTHDHLDYHLNLENYYLAKKRLFCFPSVKNIVINIDDLYGKRLLTELLENDKNFDKNIMVYGFSEDIFEYYLGNSIEFLVGKEAKILKTLDHKQEIELKLINSKNSLTETLCLKTNLLGKFNVYNLMAVVASLYLNNYSLSEIIQYSENLSSAPGRMEKFYCKLKQVTIIVDYAHTPDALGQALISLRTHARNKVWCVFGCGGDRDKAKRPEMGRIAALYSDQIIITDDNPRTEEPEIIISEIIKGIANNHGGKLVEIIHDRKQAIIKALQLATSHDIILISGKGHEDYQVYGHKKIDYNEREFVKNLVFS